METVDQFEKRKSDHIRIALDDSSQPVIGNGLDQIQLTHEALPDFNFSDTEIESVFFGKKFSSPMFVSSMTAGHTKGEALNLRIAQACGEKNWPMAVGSQRRQLFDAEAMQEWKTIRRQSPKTHFIGNIGIAQLIESSIDDIKSLADSLEALAMIVHTNPLQEVLQPEGTTNFSGSYRAIEKLCNSLNLPVVLKETGCGISQSTAERLNGLGLAAVDIAGFGGTHWGRVEGARSEESSLYFQAADTFKNWGISTLESLKNTMLVDSDYQVWASGGLRSGLDAAKCLALGSKATGFAKPIMQAALVSSHAVTELMNRYEFELKTALFCTGNKTVLDLQSKKPFHFLERSGGPDE